MLKGPIRLGPCSNKFVRNIVKHIALLEQNNCIDTQQCYWQCIRENDQVEKKLLTVLFTNLFERNHKTMAAYSKFLVFRHFKGEVD